MHPEFIESPVTLRAADEVEIPAVLTHPTEEVRQCVVMLHGITTHKNEYANFYGDMAHCLAKEGVTSLRIDFRGHGDSCEKSRSFSIVSQVLDTIAAKDWLLAHTGFHRIHIIGSSFGSPPGIFVAKKYPSTIATLNLVCPVLDYEATFLNPATEWAQGIFNEQTISEAFNTGALLMPEGFILDVKLLLEMELVRPYEILSEIQTPTLIIHGEADSMVPYDLSVKHTRDQPHIRLIGVPRMDHGFNDEDDESGQSAASRRNFELIVNAVLDHMRRSS